MTSKSWLTFRPSWSSGFHWNKPQVIFLVMVGAALIWCSSWDRESGLSAVYMSSDIKFSVTVARDKYLDRKNVIISHPRTLLLLVFYSHSVCSLFKSRVSWSWSMKEIETKPGSNVHLWGCAWGMGAITAYLFTPSSPASKGYLLWDVNLSPFFLQMTNTYFINRSVWFSSIFGEEIGDQNFINNDMN